MKNTKKVALVTGANKGIGFEIARGLGKQGFLVLLGARDEARGTQAAQTLRDEKLDVKWLPIDVASRESITRAIDAVRAEHGSLDVLVNNAGIASTDSAADIGKIFRTNVIGLTDVTLAFLPLLEQSRGQVINVSSSLGSFAFHTSGDVEATKAGVQWWAYSASKSAVNALTVHWSHAFAPRGVRVNAVCPGYCATDLNDHQGVRTPAQGAAIAIKLATETNGGSGRYVDDAGTVAW